MNFNLDLLYNIDYFFLKHKKLIPILKLPKAKRITKECNYLHTNIPEWYKSF